jgi:hypothetical protein
MDSTMLTQRHAYIEDENRVDEIIPFITQIVTGLPRASSTITNRLMPNRGFVPNSIYKYDRRPDIRSLIIRIH